MTIDVNTRAKQMRDNLKAEIENDPRFFGPVGPGSPPILQDHWARKFCGGAVLSHVQYKANAPIWNIETDKSVMKNHDDITGSVLTNFLRQLYRDSVAFPAE